MGKELKCSRIEAYEIIEGFLTHEVKNLPDGLSAEDHKELTDRLYKKHWDNFHEIVKIFKKYKGRKVGEEQVIIKNYRE